MPGVRHNPGVTATLADCAPTLLALLGQRIPDDMEGRVIEEIFERPPVIEHESSGTSPRQVPVGTSVAASDEVYSEADIKAVTDRLADLGYLE